MVVQVVATNRFIILLHKQCCKLKSRIAWSQSLLFLQRSSSSFSSSAALNSPSSCSKSSCSWARTVFRAGAAMSTTVEAAETRSEALQALLWSFCGTISKLEVQKGLQEDDFPKCRVQNNLLHAHSRPNQINCWQSRPLKGKNPVISPKIRFFSPQK